MPTQSDIKQQTQAAPAADQGMAGSVTRRARKSLTIASSLGTF
jgi:hypothetical protein